jgi:2-succinyl-5-enolpyruvyl-6-hydroxy-3-cyclohexene-1-carboxylate synthase
MKHTDKKNIQLLVHILHRMGLEHVVFSPGSRSAPLVKEFNAYNDIQKHVHFDERCAGFIALGLAQQTKKIIAVFCTSGTAVLNLAPAICEAYYQKIPLLILTADRPESAIGKGENQVIVQNEIFKNYIKKSFVFSENDFDSNTILNALTTTWNANFGPVHINLPLTEPLYSESEKVEMPALNYTIHPGNELSKSAKSNIKEQWLQAERRMIICGMDSFNQRKNDLLHILNQDAKTVLLKEACSNIVIDNTIENIDGAIAMISEDVDGYIPDLVVTLGKQIVSKSIRKLLNAHQGITHFHISIENEQWDIFSSLTQVFECGDNDFLNSIIKQVEQSGESKWQESWFALQKKYHQFRKETILPESVFVDADIYQEIAKSDDKNLIIQWGNSTPIRYASLFSFSKNIGHFANRGTSGIDGCLSTAIGAALAEPQKKVITVIGDVSFFYDSNAFFVNKLPSNFKVIVINNSGGNIFRVIDGEKDDDLMRNYFETQHKHSAEFIAKMHGIQYFKVSEKQNLSKTLNDFLLLKDKCAILECATDNYKSASFFKKLLNKK